MHKSFSWVMSGLSASCKYTWLITLPVNIISTISTLLVNIIVLGAFALIFALFTGKIPEETVTRYMNTIGDKVIHYVDPNGDRIRSLTEIRKSPAIHTPGQTTADTTTHTPD